MSGDEYLASIIFKYTVDTSKAMKAAEEIIPLLYQWGNGYLVGVDFSGSLAKGTGISIGTDADIFLSLSSTTPGTLADMYNTLYKAVTASGYTARKQNVSIGVQINGYSIDLVPGKRHSQHGSDHSLFRNKANSRIQTNIAKHIVYVKDSGRIDEIKILKVWRQLHHLEFPSFFLEMAVIDALSYARVGNLADNILTVLSYLRDKIESVRCIDPANTNNVVSDDCTNAEKSAIATQAFNSCSKQFWKDVVW